MFVFQMNRPIQVKPADNEGRGGKSSVLIIFWLIINISNDLVRSSAHQGCFQLYINIVIFIE